MRICIRTHSLLNRSGWMRIQWGARPYQSSLRREHVNVHTTRARPNSRARMCPYFACCSVAIILPHISLTYHTYRWIRTEHISRISTRPVGVCVCVWYVQLCSNIHIRCTTTHTQTHTKNASRVTKRSNIAGAYRARGNLNAEQY